MLSELLNKLIARQDLAQAEAAALLEAILADDATDSRIAAALVALLVYAGGLIASFWLPEPQQEKLPD